MPPSQPPAVADKDQRCESCGNSDGTSAKPAISNASAMQKVRTSRTEEGLPVIVQQAGQVRGSRRVSPAWHQRMAYVQLVKNARHHEIDEIFDSLRMMIKAWAGRQDHGSRPCQTQHVFEMNDRQRRFTRHQDQLAAFLDDHVGGPFDQLAGQPLGDRREGSQRARADDHGVGWVGAAGDWRKPFFAPVHLESARQAGVAFFQAGACLAGTCRQVEPHLLSGDDLRDLRVEELNPAAGGEQAFEQAHTVRHAGGAGKGQADGFRHGRSQVVGLAILQAGGRQSGR
jgi:hypothetical protein